MSEFSWVTSPTRVISVPFTIRDVYSRSEKGVREIVSELDYSNFYKYRHPYFRYVTELLYLKWSRLDRWW